jgi:uncharacterized Zn-finger protein
VVVRSEKVEGVGDVENHLLATCPKCKKVFGKPLVMLDFSGGKTLLVNVCPYCNYVLGRSDESVRSPGTTEFVDLDRRRVEQK